MRKAPRSAISIVLTTVLCTTSSFPASVFGYKKTSTPQNQERRNEARNVRLKHGPEVVQRVTKLKQSNKQVRNALKIFENNSWKNGRQPKLNEAISITGTSALPELVRARECKDCSKSRKVSLRVQDPLPEANIEIIFIPTLNVPGEWQGTVIFNMYDLAGNFLAQYVAAVVMFGPGWNVIYEVSFEGDQAYLESDPALGMITDPYFEFGTPTMDQPGNVNPILPQTSSVFGGKFRKASFSLSKASVEPQGWRGGIGPRYPVNPRMRQFGVCAGAICVGALVGCGAASLIFGGATFGSCATTGCVGGAVTCGIRTALGQ